MGDDMSKILNYFDIWLVTYLRFWIFFDIWQAFCSRTPLLLDVSAAVFDGCGGWFFCLQTAVFSGYFFLKICARNNAVKKKRFYGLFLRFCLYL